MRVATLPALLFLTSPVLGGEAGSCGGRTTLFGKTMLGADFDPVLLNDRVGIQSAYSIEEKGWLVGLEW